MSHAATNWAIKQKGLKPATKIVLWYLCDRHNPDYGCFPSQETLSLDCEMSERSVRRHLESLEEIGLVRRIKRKGDGGTYMSDRYMLGFEEGFTPEPAANLSSGQNGYDPAAKTGTIQRPICPPNTVIEPLKESVISPRATAKQKAFDVLSQVASEEAATGFIEMRWAIKKPLTEYAASLIAKQLTGRMNADDILNLSTGKCWSGIYPDSNELQGTHNGTGNRKARTELENDATLELIAQVARSR